MAGYVARIVKSKISYAMPTGKPIEKYFARKNWV
jgi:hypothetical protein